MKRATVAPVLAAAVLLVVPAAPAAATTMCTELSSPGDADVCVRNEPSCTKVWGMVDETPGPVSGIAVDTGCL